MLVEPYINSGDQENGHFSYNRPYAEQRIPDANRESRYRAGPRRNWPNYGVVCPLRAGRLALGLPVSSGPEARAPRYLVRGISWLLQVRGFAQRAADGCLEPPFDASRRRRPVTGFSGKIPGVAAASRRRNYCRVCARDAACKSFVCESVSGACTYSCERAIELFARLCAYVCVCLRVWISQLVAEFSMRQCHVAFVWGKNGSVMWYRWRFLSTHCWIFSLVSSSIENNLIYGLWYTATLGQYRNSIHDPQTSPIRGKKPNAVQRIKERSLKEGKYYLEFFYNEKAKSWFSGKNLVRDFIVTINRLRSNHYNLAVASLARINLIKKLNCKCGHDTEDII